MLIELSALVVRAARNDLLAAARREVKFRILDALGGASGGRGQCYSI